MNLPPLEHTIQTVREYLEAKEYTYFLDEDHIFYLTFDINSPIKITDIRIYCREDSIMVNALVPIGPSPYRPKEILEMCRFLCLVNVAVTCGNFEMDCDEGRIRFKTGFLFQPGCLLSEVVDTAIDWAVDSVEMFASGFLDVISGVYKAQQAYENCWAEHADERPVRYDA